MNQCNIMLHVVQKHCIKGVVYIARWWWSHFFYFRPKNRGNDPFWRAYFSNGWGKTHRPVSVPPQNLTCHVCLKFQNHFERFPFIACNHQYSGDTPRKINGWNLRIRAPGIQENHLPNHHHFRFKLFIFRGCMEFFTWFAGWIIFPIREIPGLDPQIRLLSRLTLWRNRVPWRRSRCGASPRVKSVMWKISEFGRCL